MKFVIVFSILMLQPYVLTLLAGDLSSDKGSKTHPTKGAIQEELPIDVKKLIERVSICTHLAGEEPYSQERAAELASGIKKNRCAKLDQDQARIEKKYSKNPSVISAIKKANEFGT